MTTNPYEVLGIGREASESEIRKRYADRIAEIRKALADGRKIDPATLDDLRAAYRTLTDRSLRAALDASLNGESISPSATSPEGAALPAGAAVSPAQRKQLPPTSGRQRDPDARWWSRLPAWKAFLFFALIPGVIASVIHARLFGSLGHLLQFAAVMPPVLIYVIEAALLTIWFGGLWLWWRNAYHARRRWLGTAQRALIVISGAWIGATSALFLVRTTAATYLVANLTGISMTGMKSLPESLNALACEPELLEATTDLAKLHVNARCGDLDAVKRLVAAGVDVNTKDPSSGDDRNALHHAVSSGQIAIVEYLLAHGAEPNRTGRGLETALHIAAGKGIDRAIGPLLRAKADPDALAGVVGGPLHAAVLQGNPQAAALLVAGGADPNLRNGQGETPLHMLRIMSAVYPGHAETIEILARAGADFNAVDGQGHAIIDRAKPALAATLVKHGARPAPADPFQAMSAAASAGNREALVLLEAQGMPVNIKDGAGRTLLHAAAQYGSADATDAIAFLLDRGLDPNAANNRGRTALHDAVEHCYPKMAAYLLKRGANASAPTELGVTPLHQMLASNNLSMANCRAAIIVVIDAGAPVQIRDGFGRSPLHVASSALDVQGRLLARGADPNARDDKGQTPLHLLAHNSASAKAVAALVNAGADVNAQDRLGRTPLHMAAERPLSEKELETYKALVERRARVDLVDAKGLTARMAFDASLRRQDKPYPHQAAFLALLDSAAAAQGVR